MHGRYRELFSFSTLHPQENTDLISGHCSFEVNFFYAAFNELKAKMAAILRIELSACVCHWH